MDAKEFKKHLFKAILEAGGQTDFAKAHKLSTSYVNDCLHGRRKPGPKILKSLGLKAVISYQEVK